MTRGAREGFHHEMSARDEVSAHLDRLVRRLGLRSPWLWAVAVALFALYIYRRAPGLGFVFEDESLLLRSDAVRAPVSVLRALSTDVWGAPRDASWQTGVYRPLTSLVWAVVWRLGHGTPRLFHALSALLHALSSALVLRFAWGRFGSNIAAVVAGSVFAAHTLHTDAVFPATNLGDILGFLAAAAVCTVHGRGGSTQRVGAPAALLLGALSSELTLVALALVMIRDARDGVAWRTWPTRYAGYAFSLVAYIALRTHALGPGSRRDLSLYNPLSGASTAQRAITAARTFGKATRLTMAPLDLLPDYAPGAILPSSKLDADVALGAGVLATLAALTAWSWRRRHALGDAATWTLVAGLVAVNVPFVLARPFSEHGWYMASAGACVLFGAAFARVAHRVGTLVAASALAVVLLALTALTASRHAVWASTEMLMLDASQVHRDSAVAQVAYGEVHITHGAPFLALRRCRHASRVMPRWAEPWGCIARAMEREGRLPEAHEAYATMLAREGVTLDRRTQHLRFVARDGDPAGAIRALDALERQGPWSTWHRLNLAETRLLVTQRLR